MGNNKFATYIGFAIRSNKYRTGMNSVQTLKKASLMIVCNTASINTKKLAKKVAQKLRCKVVETALQPLIEYTFTQNTKVMAILDGSLAKAITENCVDFIKELD